MGNHCERPGDETLLRKTAIRIVKDKAGFYGIPEIHFDADFYCVGMEEPAWRYETEDEFVFYVEHMCLKDACLVTASLEADPRWKPAAVLCEGRRLEIRQDGDKIQFPFEISGLTGKTRTLFVHTILREPGLTIRIEQNSEGRRAGVYRREAYPAVQIEAASHYIFAMREILKLLDVPQYLSQEGLGYILLLSFETCNELHGDWPPHWHFIFRWPDHCGSQAPHIYLDEQGRMIHNIMYIDMIPNVQYTYEPGVWCPFVDRYGRNLLRLRIEADGGMSVTREGRRVYTMSPYTPSGVTVTENGRLVGSVQVENDVRRGCMQVHWRNGNQGDWSETIDYDPLTGVMTKRTQAPMDSEKTTQ